ncbi:MAG: class I SAM-dependent methyltransferase [Myxococcota bacterium]
MLRMVEQARRNLSGWASDDLIHFEVQDGQSLSFEDAQFDAVFSSFGIFLFPNRQAGW